MSSLDVENRPPGFKWIEYTRVLKDQLLAAEPDSPYWFTISSVPHHLRKWSPTSYKPQVISLGLYGRKLQSEERKVSPMEKCRIDLARESLKVLNIFNEHGWNSLCRKVVKHPHRMLDLYVDAPASLGIRNVDLKYVLTLDALLLTGFIQGWCFPKAERPSHLQAVMQKPANLSHAHLALIDIFLLDNQIPLFLLQRLLKYTGSWKNQELDKELCDLVWGSVRLVLKHLPGHSPKRLEESHLETYFPQSKHLLECLYRVVCRRRSFQVDDDQSCATDALKDHEAASPGKVGVLEPISPNEKLVPLEEIEIHSPSPQPDRSRPFKGQIKVVPLRVSSGKPIQALSRKMSSLLGQGPSLSARRSDPVTSPAKTMPKPPIPEIVSTDVYESDNRLDEEDEDKHGADTEIPLVDVEALQHSFDWRQADATNETVSEVQLCSALISVGSEGDDARSFHRPLPLFTNPKKRTLSDDDLDRIPTATQLHRSGVKLKSFPGSEGILDIQFVGQKATLFLPKIDIDENTEILLKNLAAYECMSEAKQDILAYMNLMDGLIDTEADVEIMMKAGVIGFNGLGSNRNVAEMWNRAMSGYPTMKLGNYRPVLRAMSIHCNNRHNELRKEFIDTFFSRPWVTISVVTATLLLILTFLQTLYSMLAFYKQYP